jgi:hypothetical protein
MDFVIKLLVRATSLWFVIAGLSVGLVLLYPQSMGAVGEALADRLPGGLLVRRHAVRRRVVRIPAD